MPEITRRRTIRPSTRVANSVNYRVHLDRITPNDTLIVIITHEAKPFEKTFKFRGSDVLKKKSLGFRVADNGKEITITWVSTQPIYG